MEKIVACMNLEWLYFLIFVLTRAIFFYVSEYNLSLTQAVLIYFYSYDLSLN